MEEQTPSNPLLVTNKPSDASLQVLLHPLVILTISDHITRHQLRDIKKPIVGAILGQQNGREVSLEHAFECRVEADEAGEVVQIHEEWFQEKLQQFKDVHKVPALDLVGWFTLLPPSGPQSVHIPIHQHILHKFNESAVLLGFHPSLVDQSDSSSSGGKLPLTVYESLYEDVVGSAGAEGEGDKAMQIDSAVAAKTNLRFRALSYVVETGEAEMISLNFVARGGGNATAIEGASAPTAKPDEQHTESESSAAHAARGKQLDSFADPAGDQTTTPTTTTADHGTDEGVLSPEDEEKIINLTARINAIKMLHSRLHLLKSYLTSLPPSYLTSDSSVAASVANTSTTAEQQSSTNSPPSSSTVQVNHTLLRSIQSLLQRLPLLLPPDTTSYVIDSLAERNDVVLVQLLGELGTSIVETKAAGKKFSILENGRMGAKKGGRGGGGGGAASAAFGGVGGSGVGRGGPGGGAGGGWPSGMGEVDEGNMDIVMGEGDGPYAARSKGGRRRKGRGDRRGYDDAEGFELDDGADSGARGGHHGMIP